MTMASIPELAVERRHHPVCERVKVTRHDIIVLVGVPEGNTEDEVEEHDAKRPQIVRDTRLTVSCELRGVDLALIVRRLQQHRHLGRQ